MNYQELEKNLVSLAIGIKYDNNFIINDFSGSIMDNILFSKESNLNSEVFIQFARNSSGIKLRIPISRNDILDTGDNGHVIINNTDIVFDMSLFEKFTKKYIIQEFNNSILRNINNVVIIKNIKRLGYLKRYKISNLKIIEYFLNHFNIDNTCDINKLNIDYSFIEKNDDKQKDVITINYILQRIDIKDFIITVDFQVNYTDELETLKEIKYDDFINQAEKHIEKVFLPWIISMEEMKDE